MEKGLRRDVVVGGWTLAITASPDGAVLQVEALRLSTTSGPNTRAKKGPCAFGCDARVVECVTDVEVAETTVTLLPANKVDFFTRLLSFLPLRLLF
jgi:hypothetical protein